MLQDGVFIVQSRLRNGNKRDHVFYLATGLSLGTARLGGRPLLDESLMDPHGLVRLQSQSKHRKSVIKSFHNHPTVRAYNHKIHIPFQMMKVVSYRCQSRGHTILHMVSSHLGEKIKRFVPGPWDNSEKKGEKIYQSHPS